MKRFFFRDLSCLLIRFFSSSKRYDFCIKGHWSFANNCNWLSYKDLKSLSSPLSLHQLFYFIFTLNGQLEKDLEPPS